LRAALLALAVAISWTQPRSARADVRECIERHGEGQVLRDDSHFLDARSRFVSCAEPACPEAIRLECADFLAQLERAMPSVVLSARERGHDLVDVRVELDGQLLEGALAGRAIAVDPGAHHFRFLAADGRVREVEIVAQEAVKGRLVEADFSPPAQHVPAPPPPSPAPAASSRTVPTIAYVLGGLGGAALAGFGYFAWTGKSRHNELAKICAPSCPPAEVSSVRSKYLVGDILLGVGVAALGAGTYFYFSVPEPSGQAALANVRGTF